MNRHSLAAMYFLLHLVGCGGSASLPELRFAETVDSQEAAFIVLFDTVGDGGIPVTLKSSGERLHVNRRPVFLRDDFRQAVSVGANQTSPSTYWAFVVARIHLEEISVTPGREPRRQQPAWAVVIEELKNAEWLPRYSTPIR